MNSSPVRSMTRGVVPIVRGSSSRSRTVPVIRSSLPLSQTVSASPRLPQATTSWLPATGWLVSPTVGLTLRRRPRSGCRRASASGARVERGFESRFPSRTPSLLALRSAGTRLCVRCMLLQPSVRCVRPSPRAEVTQTAASPGFRVTRSAQLDADETTVPITAPVCKPIRLHRRAPINDRAVAVARLHPQTRLRDPRVRPTDRKTRRPRNPGTPNSG
jgi:hypothetical protein